MKSQKIFFIIDVNTFRKEELIDLLNMRQVDNHEKYLKIQLWWEDQRSNIYNTYGPNMEKLQGWKKKLILKEGNEVLLRSMIQAIPIYFMGV